MPIETEDWNVIIDEFNGWQTDSDSDDIPDGKSPDVLNVRFAGSHVRGALGYELIGSRNEDPGEITSQYTYNRNDGKQILVHVRDNGASGDLEWYDEVNDEFYTLLAGLTTGTKMGFVEYNTSTTNQMVFCNGVNNMSVWTGATTRLTASASGSSDTLNVEDTTDFPASGTIIYNGTEKAYDSKTATSFHAASGNWHASAGSNDGVAQAADDSTHSGITKGNILLSAKDRLWIAGQPDAPSAFDYSDEGAAFTFTGGANRADSGTEDVFNIGGRITGLSEKGEEIIVLGPDGAVGFSFQFPTSNTKLPIYREIFRAPGQGCLSPRSVIKVNNEVYFANRNGIVALGDLEGTEKVVNRSVTREIAPTTAEYDFSEASGAYFDKENIIVMACKSSPDFPGNDIVIGADFFRVSNEDGQAVATYALTKLDWPANDFSILGDDIYFGSSLEQNSFRGFSTYQNDGAPRRIKYAMKRFNLKNPFQEKGACYAAVKGFIKDGTDINTSILYNAGFLGENSKIIESSGNYVSSATLNTIGAFSNGTNPIGATREEVSELKQFLVYLDLGNDHSWNDIELIFESETDGGTFIITHVGLTAAEEGFAVRDDLMI